MPQLDAQIGAEKFEDVAAGEFSFSVAFTNSSSEPARLNLHQASHPALVLDVRDRNDRQVLLPPPSAPDPEDLEEGQVIVPGESVSIDYAGFLDRSLAPGEYRIRYSASSPRSAVQRRIRSGANGLRSRSGQSGASSPGSRSPASNRGRTTSSRVRSRRGCVSSSRFGSSSGTSGGGSTVGSSGSCLGSIATTSDPRRSINLEPRRSRKHPPGFEAWNGTYSWRARFLLTLDEPNCTARVLIRVRLVGTIIAAQRTAWETAIEAAWNSRFKLCRRACCCSDGLRTVTDIQFVTSGEHQVVNVGTTTTNMGNWGASDTVDVSHEFGHMLGALDEYFTVNGVDWGVARQPTGAIMNNPANPPVARHYSTMRQAAGTLRGATYLTVAQLSSC